MFQLSNWTMMMLNKKLNKLYNYIDIFVCIYGENDNGIFFFTPDGKYVEWTGTYLYSDIPFEVNDPVINYTEVE